MKHIKLFEEFKFEDKLLNQACAELRKVGYSKAYWEEEKGTQEMLLHVDAKNVFYVFDSRENKDGKQDYHLRRRDDDSEAIYSEDSHDIKDIIAHLKK